jgi:hypothetical protein
MSGEGSQGGYSGISTTQPCIVEAGTRGSGGFEAQPAAKPKPSRQNVVSMGMRRIGTLDPL